MSDIILSYYVRHNLCFTDTCTKDISIAIWHCKLNPGHRLSWRYVTAFKSKVSRINDLHTLMKQCICLQSKHHVSSHRCQNHATQHQKCNGMIWNGWVSTMNILNGIIWLDSINTTGWVKKERQCVWLHIFKMRNQFERFFANFNAVLFWTNLLISNNQIYSTKWRHLAKKPPPRILVGRASMHLASPIIGQYIWHF